MDCPLHGLIDSFCCIFLHSRHHVAVEVRPDPNLGMASSVPKVVQSKHSKPGRSDPFDSAMDEVSRLWRAIGMGCYKGIIIKPHAELQELALLWQIVFSPLFFTDLLSAIWAMLGRRPKNEIDDGVTCLGRDMLLRS